MYLSKTSRSCLRELSCRTVQGEEEAVREEIAGAAAGGPSQVTKQPDRALKSRQLLVLAALERRLKGCFDARTL